MPERAPAKTVGENSAEAIVGMANPSEGPNMKTKGEASRFMVMAAPNIPRSRPGAAGGEALEHSRRCVK